MKMNTNENILLVNVLGLGSEARMNVPSSNNGNWQWRYKPGVLTDALARKLAVLSEVTDRIPVALPSRPSEDFVA